MKKRFGQVNIKDLELDAMRIFLIGTFQLMKLKILNTSFTSGYHKKRLELLLSVCKKEIVFTDKVISGTLNNDYARRINKFNENIINERNLK